MKIKKIICCSVLLISGLAFLIPGIMFSYNVLSPGFWPSVSGIITDSEIKTVNFTNSKEYYPVFTYTYEVDGRRYKNDIYSSSRNIDSVTLTGLDLDSDIEEVMNKIDEIKYTEDLRVHYNPQDPSVSYIVFEAYHMIPVGMMLSGGIFFIAMCIYSFFKDK